MNHEECLFLARSRDTLKPVSWQLFGKSRFRVGYPQEHLLQILAWKTAILKSTRIHSTSCFGKYFLRRFYCLLFGTHLPIQPHAYMCIDLLRADIAVLSHKSIFEQVHCFKGGERKDRFARSRLALRKKYVFSVKLHFLLFQLRRLHKLVCSRVRPSVCLFVGAYKEFYVQIDACMHATATRKPDKRAAEMKTVQISWTINRRACRKLRSAWR